MAHSNDTRQVALDDGRVLVVHDTVGQGADAPADALTLIWHHGSPQTGTLLAPLVSAAAARGIRLLSYGRPSYGGSTPSPGRTVASAGADVEEVVDSLGVGRFAVMGASGGGPHALACAASMGDRVIGAVCFAGIAPLTSAVDWWGGMAAPGGLQAALAGRQARALFAETDEFDEQSFVSADWSALEGEWSSLGTDAQAAGAAGPDGLIDDDVSFVSPWGFDLGQVAAPVLIAQGGLDRVVPRAHAEFLVTQLPSAELWLRPRDGHVSILDRSTVAMDWLLDLSR